MTFKGTSHLRQRQNRSLRRSLLAITAMLAVGGCASSASTEDSGSVVTTVVPATDANSDSSVAAGVVTTAPVVESQLDVRDDDGTVDDGTVDAETGGALASSSGPTTVLSPTTSVRAPSTTVGAPTTSVGVPGTTVRPASGVRPQLVLSQSGGLNPAGSLITVRGTGFDETKGIYLFVCNQAAWTAARRCIGGINLDGASPLSQWISSNPPGYAKGLTLPYEANGTFSVTLLVRATDDATNLINCAVEQCGVVAFADHTRRDDRSQDVFVPITFGNRP